MKPDLASLVTLDVGWSLTRPLRPPAVEIPIHFVEFDIYEFHSDRAYQPAVNVSTLWAGSKGWGGAWTCDTSTAATYHGSIEDGVGQTKRTHQGKLFGFNEHRLEAILFAPDTDTPVIPLLPALRELTEIVANTSAPTGLYFGEPVRFCKWHKEGHTWVDLSLRSVMPGADIDPFDLTRIMSWQPCDIPTTSTPGQAPRESASLEALASLRDPAQGTADPIIVDGVVPTALIQELSRMCHIQYQGG